MMQKLWLAKPKLNYSEDIFDIVQFGSSVREGEEPGDIDIAIIFRDVPLKEQLSQSQEIKRQLQKLVSLEIHVKSFTLYSLFDRGNFARESIFFYGKSILTGDCFSRKFGLFPRININYNLKELKKKDKVKFNYLINGKSGEYGLLRKYGGKLLAPTLIQISQSMKRYSLSRLAK